jgi:hypothetical protein
MKRREKKNTSIFLLILYIIIISYSYFALSFHWFLWTIQSNLIFFLNLLIMYKWASAIYRERKKAIKNDDGHPVVKMTHVL